MDNGEIKFELSEEASFRELGDEGIILMADTGQLYSTNATGTALMNQLENGLNFQEIINAISNEFDVNSQVLAEDLLEFTDHLVSEGVLRKTPSD